MQNKKIKNQQLLYAYILSILLLMALALPASAKDIPSRKPSKEGISQERLDRLTTHMNQAVEDGTMVGGLGLIARNGKVV
jgi:hypothetical protein